VALYILSQRQVVERKGDRPLRPKLPEHRKALLAVRPHSRDIALIACHIAKAQQTVGHPLAVLKCAVELQALVEQRRSVCKIALLAPYQRQKAERIAQATTAQAATIAQRAVARHRVFEQFSRPLILAHCACLHRRVDEQLRLTLTLPQGTAQCHALLKELRGTRVIVLIGGQPGCHIQRLQACGTGNNVG
jgi:hypothetical protein